MQTYPTGYAESHRMAEKTFREILPRHGMAVREEQIALCHEVLDTLYNKEISLCEAGVGTGKTLAYLVGCILWQMNRPERMKLPIVISTSSVALQDAILTEYLPDLSAILLDEGIITAPITAVVRKGNVEQTLKSTRQIEKILDSGPPLTYFDEHTFTEMVKKVSVSNTAIEFELINGMKLSEERTEK